MSELPSKSQILQWIGDHPTQTSKRDIAKAFGIKGAARIDLKRVLKELELEGHLEKRKKTYRDPERLPPVSILQITGLTSDGEMLARPLEWRGDGEEPIVLVMPRASDPAMGDGDRILARLQEVNGETHHYEARLIRRIGTNPRKILGLFSKRAEGGRLLPIDKGSGREWVVPAGAT
ncbi:MAG: ribonuclease R, partial [Pseudomonadota bacterium]